MFHSIPSVTVAAEKTHFEHHLPESMLCRPMASSPKKRLIKGSLRPVIPNASSYTELRASPEEVVIRRDLSVTVVGKLSSLERSALGHHLSEIASEFSSQAFPKPFLDPAILERQREEEKQRRLMEEKRQKQQES